MNYYYFIESPFIIIGYLALSILVGIAGNHRTIGFLSAFILSIFFSPLVGVIGVALSRRNPDESLHRFKDDEQRDEFLKLKEKRIKGLISEAEFMRKRDELMG